MLQFRLVWDLSNLWLWTKVFIQGIMHGYVVVVSGTQARSMMVLLPIHHGSHNNKDSENTSCTDADDSSSGKTAR